MSTRKHVAAWTILTCEEERRLLDSIRKSNDMQSLRDYTIVSLALATGLRVREIAELRCGDVLTPTGRVKQVVDLPFAKGGSLEPAHFGEPIRRRLEVWIDGLRRQCGDYPLDEVALWPVATASSNLPGKPLCVRAIQATFAKRVRQAGIGRRVHFHALRHTFCSRLSEQTNGNLPVVQKLARHADARTTSRYIHVPVETLLRAVDAVLVG